MTRRDRPKLLALAPLIGLVALSSSAAAQGLDIGKVEIATEQLAPNVYALTGSPGVDPVHPDGAGGRIGVLVGRDGILMVDAQYAELTDKVVAAIRRISPAPIRFLVNTHIHPDHTGSNASFAKMGVTIFAREELRAGMVRQAGAANPAPGKDAAAYPVVTYSLDGPVKIHLNGEVVDLIPVKAAHTGGDTMIRFENANVILIGDFYRNFGYPFIALADGGSVQGMLDALDATMALAGPDTKLVPGHGSIVTREALVPYRDMIRAVHGQVQQMIAQGKTLEEVLAAKLTAPYDAKVPGGLSRAGAGTTADRFVTALYQELKSAR
jgi:glyoxylase-like metal-dependent hydrolase (beta-lactamase superfamily II)